MDYYQNIPIPVIEVSIVDGKILQVNQAAIDNLGLPICDIVGQSNHTLFHSPASVESSCPICNHIVNKSTIKSLKLFNETHDTLYLVNIFENTNNPHTMFQTIISYECNMIPVANNRAYILDILKERETYYYKAHHHPLTHLPNRELFIDRLIQSIHNSQRNKLGFSLLFIDIDNFKKVNDAFGHTIGDKVLIEIGNRLNNATRKIDTVAHFHGDEFAIIMKNVKHVQDTQILIEKILNIVQLPINVDGHTIQSSVSIGISQYPLDSSDPHTLFKYADLAMYQSKIKGNNTFTYYNKISKINTYTS